MKQFLFSRFYRLSVPNIAEMSKKEEKSWIDLSRLKEKERKIVRERNFPTIFLK